MTREQLIAHFMAQQNTAYVDPTELLRRQAEINARQKYGDFIDMVEIDGVWQVNPLDHEQTK